MEYNVFGQMRDNARALRFSSKKHIGARLLFFSKGTRISFSKVRLSPAITLAFATRTSESLSLSLSRCVRLSLRESDARLKSDGTETWRVRRCENKNKTHPKTSLAPRSQKLLYGYRMLSKECPTIFGDFVEGYVQHTSVATVFGAEDGEAYLRTSAPIGKDDSATNLDLLDDESRHIIKFCAHAP